MSTVAALETIAILEDGQVYERMFELGDRLRSGLCEIVDRLGIPAQVSGYGSVFVVYFVELNRPVRSYTDLLDNDHDRYVRFHRGMVERGVFMLPLTLKRNHLSASHDAEDVARTLQAAEDTLREIATGKKG